MKEQWIASVGIDIGTSTTKLIVSRLRLVRVSSAAAMPRYEIPERQLLYASPIHGTPLKGEDELDADGVWAIVTDEYRNAGIRPGELKSGAVIITGETATKRNAREMIHRLAERAGDFVVAAAGANLEGLLAGRGAGAEALSMETREAVANIDIGGGTANVAVFRRGNPIGTVTFHVGGRLIRIDRDGTVAAVSPSIRPWLGARGFVVEPGHKVSMGMLERICAAMCRDMLDAVAGVSEPSRDAAWKKLLVGESGAMPRMPAIEAWTFSGGIGHLLMESPPPVSMAEAAAYGDIGPLLAHSLRVCLPQYAIRLEKPTQTVRATVIGAGMQSTVISGATVHIDARLLPIRSLPVHKLALPVEADNAGQELLAEAVADAMRLCAGLYDRGASPPFALALTGLKTVSYAAVLRLAEAILHSYTSAFSGSEILVVVCEQDMAQSLGQSLQLRAGERLSVICVDQIAVEHGDFIDLGEPLPGRMIPVVVKTLAFQSGFKGG
ncbi:ethanolamine ammonia-lyase reactivating factor EutA [Paenibacillus montanisoli]|uniref:Ethanolamine utilization protein n=1 Tax=Paenibacillus montanisoli TaxID=2081970 RepID=A0A328TX72_9BACL|nr:ethanolamine ammonia-lyase reactivating factor EutA [Paenibacillus montanisoli]RAP75068.1 ethanolamine utilization protein [Paenibacillus montanisoli]